MSLSSLNAAPNPGRLHYIDALRSFCMLYGVFVHTSTLGDFGLLDGFAVSSRYFRMSTFFLVSAFLGAMVLDRTGTRAFLAKRTLALLVPFVAALLLLNPVTLWLIYGYFDNPPLPFVEAVRASVVQQNRVAGPGVWHLHLWFLLSLYVYVLLAAPLLAVLKALPTRMMERLHAVPDRLLPTLLAGLVGATVIGLRTVQEFAAPWSSDVFLIRVTVLYLPFYTLGLFLYAQPAIWARVHRVDPLVIAIAAVLLLVQAYGPVDPDHLLGKVLAMFSRAVTNVAAICALLWAFRAVAARDTKVTRVLGDSIYTVYLFHYLLIYALVTQLAPAGIAGAALFWTVSLGAIGLGLLLHVRVIARVPALRFLFNGRPW